MSKTMLQLPTLPFPDFSLPFGVTTDAFGTAVGAFLSQNHQPIAFFSKKLSQRLASSSTYVRELYALIEAVKKWRQYLLGHTFKIFTDHKSLKSLMTQTIQTPEQQKWLKKLIGYNYEICYTRGKDNLVADALSRMPCVDSDSTFHVISSPSVPFISILKELFANHPTGKELVTKLTSTPGDTPRFTFKSGLIYFNGRLFIPDASDLRQLLIQEHHSSPIGGHFGIRASLSRLSAMFYWPNKHYDIEHYIEKCDVCQPHKYNTQKPYGLLQPLPIPTQVWEDISMDFITNIPLSANKTVIWVVVDRLTKFAHYLGSE